MKEEMTLIVPCAGDNCIDKRKMPEIFKIDDEGIMHCIRAILGLNLHEFSKIYFTILRKHADTFGIEGLLRLQFSRIGLPNARIVILDYPTGTQAETIARTIELNDINGAVFIKDADSYFKAEVLPGNSVAVYPLENLRLVDPQNKSYVAVDDMQYITNIIEKRVISNLFNAGGYGFEDIAQFMDTYGRYQHLGKIYLSHLIYAMLMDNKTFRPIKVKDYRDLNIQPL